ncbi:MAG: hypothetical protein U5L72_18095 [Bacteroidales bacterium]|nr:hypothetical protein [Bacteroidales bacterium]
MRGKYSYFTKIVTQDLDKINQHPNPEKCRHDSDTGTEEPGLRFCIKYRKASRQTLERDLLPRYVPLHPCANKVVLNIVDGIKGCFERAGTGSQPSVLLRL